MVERMKTMKRRCAVCGDKTQSNVKLKWQRESDNLVFHVCLACAEKGLVNKDNVVRLTTNQYTTYYAEDGVLPPMKRRGSTPKKSYK